MARMIPSVMDDRTPSGERDVFSMLAAGPDDWVIMHSLDLAPWNRGLRTEIDFVVIVPDCGILCIEVKSHSSITFDGTCWTPPEIKRSPFKQAADGRHAFYRRLRDIAPQFRTVPVVHMCIFPNAPFHMQINMSTQQWELMDNRIFRTFKDSSVFCRDIKLRIEEGIDVDEKLSRLKNPLSDSQVQSIVNYCLPVQKYHPNARAEIMLREQAIERILREQQKPVLKLACANDRIIVSGGAGTGKTLISMELARRKAESGQRVALLCFNQLVGQWMKEQMERIRPTLPNLVVGRSIQVMAELTGLDIPETPDGNYWNKVLPLKLEEKLTDPDISVIAPFDYLVLDETQDILLRPALWQCLIHLLNGGIREGRYALFGDFEHQVFGERELLKKELDAILQAAQPARWKLSENCRNYSIIGETAVQLSGFDEKIYTGYMRQGGSIANYNIHFYATEDEQARKLSDLLREFKQQGYRPEEITILSFSAERCAAKSQQMQEYNIRPAWQQGRFTHYCTVHAFKGLENKIIILTDVSPGEAEFHRDLFYTGMTRATESVRVLCNIKCQETLLRWLTKGGLTYV